MKATREQLKALMKELLVEILSEGLGALPASGRPTSTQRAPIVGAVTEQRLSSGRRKPQFDPRLDTPLSNGRIPSDALKDAVMRESGGNPVLADILADTARTTLPTQLSHGDAMGQPTPGGSLSMAGSHAPIQQEHFEGDPAEIFGLGGQMRDDGSSHWADLAFMSPGGPAGKK